MKKASAAGLGIAAFAAVAVATGPASAQVTFEPDPCVITLEPSYVQIPGEVITVPGSAITCPPAFSSFNPAVVDGTTLNVSFVGAPGTATTGTAISAALIGMAAGAITGGAIGDRIGRKPAIVFTALFFGLTTIATGFASNATELFLLRLVSGFGFGVMKRFANECENFSTPLTGDRPARVVETVCSSPSPARWKLAGFAARAAATFAAATPRCATSSAVSAATLTVIGASAAMNRP